MRPCASSSRAYLAPEDAPAPLLAMGTRQRQRRDQTCKAAGRAGAAPPATKGTWRGAGGQQQAAGGQGGRYRYRYFLRPQERVERNAREDFGTLRLGNLPGW